MNLQKNTAPSLRQLLSIEWMKLRHYKTFWMITGFFVLLLPLWNYGISNGIMKLGPGNDLNLVSQSYGFQNVWQNVGFWASIFVIFISILTIIITTNEYQFRTHRQNIMDGWSRLSFYHAKWSLILALSLGTTLYVFLVGTAFGMQYSSLSAFPGNIEYLLYTFILSLNYYGFAFIVALFLKRSGISIGMFFLYSMIIESMLVKYINWQTNSYYGNLLPLQCSDELLPFPIMEMVKGMLVGESTSPTATTYACVSIGWIAVYYFVGRWKLLKSDW